MDYSPHELKTPLSIAGYQGKFDTNIATISWLQDGTESMLLMENLVSVDQCMKFVQLAINTKQNYYKENPSNTDNKKPLVSDLGKHAPKLASYAKIYSRDYSFHPALIHFLTEYRQHSIAGHHFTQKDKYSIDIFEDFVSTLRKAAVSQRLKLKISNWESKYQKNWKRALKLEEAIFEDYSRVTIIRLDLEFQKNRPDAATAEKGYEAFQEAILEDRNAYRSGQEISTPCPTPGLVSLEEMQHYRQRFFSNMKGKRSLFEHCIGYVWRVECTPVAGHHLHVVLFFDGANVQKHAHLAQQIGEYWSLEITGKRGRFHNVNRNWNECDPRCGVGIISWDDAWRRENLRRYVLGYLCKKSQAVQVLPYKGCNLFGSALCRRSRSTNAGRPRTGTKHASELAMPAHSRKSPYPKSSNDWSDKNLGNTNTRW